MPNNLIRQPNFGALVVLVWLVVALVLLLQYWGPTAETLLDTDDAMRLVQMRAWLAGQGWFDLHHARLEPPGGYHSHWSRLIDAGLAGLLLLFQYFEPQSAERLMRAWWPLLWLLPTIAGMTAIAWRIAGREAAMVALLLALAGVPAYQQFTPGRIDHHNVQIALALLVTAATVWSDRKRWTAAVAGALTGLAFAIGFESVPYLAICGGMLALRYGADAEAGLKLRDYGLALAASTALALLVSVGPDRWMLNRCDAIAFNNAAAAIGAGLVLALAGWLKHADGVTRFFAVAGAGCLAAAVFVLLEPRCARGPFAMVDPAVWPVWHDHTLALQPLHVVFKTNPLTAAAVAAFPVLALLALLKLVTEPKLRRDFGFLAASLVFLAAAATMVAAVRGYSYAMWLGMPLVAGLAQRLFVAWQIERFIPRLATGLLFTPLAISAGAITIAHANGLSDSDSFARPANRHCQANASYAALAKLPPGLVIADISHGPYLLALTPHSVMGAPYHRLSTGIAVTHRVFASPPDEAKAIVNAARLVGAAGKPTYLMVCGLRPPDGLAEPARGRSLWARLAAGGAPQWLEPVGEKGAFAVWRVKL
ncbi:MAG: hypothetical protein K2Y27_08365 [Xanthobacteraceae bacterium]|nr:hypothetical protein [Xanthobacteraceae bacterium]